MTKMIFSAKSSLKYLLLGLCFSCSLFAAPSDYDGDGKTDFTVMRRNGDDSYTWFIRQSRDGFRAENFGRTFAGVSGDSPFVPGDYDGDGKTDLAVARSNEVTNLPVNWYVLNSGSQTLTGVQFGVSQDYMAPADYDGDGKTDIAVFRGGWWYILQSRDGFYAEQFGLLYDRPLSGNDYDGDGKDDLAVVRYTSSSPGSPIPTILYIRLSGNGTWQAWNVGDARVTWVVSGDYDGDGKSDVAVWRGRQWLWVRSSDNRVESANFGESSDGPLPGDYDGDGKTDPAVIRPLFNYEFHVLQSRDGYKAVQWGKQGDFVVSSLDRERSLGF